MNTSSNSPITVEKIRQENRNFTGQGGISQENRSFGFVPAFLDTLTNTVYLSRHADGRLAPIHLLDGLPSTLVEQRSAAGAVVSAKSSVMTGFMLQGQFFTREQAARAVSM